jgi:hypothetical protein
MQFYPISLFRRGRTVQSLLMMGNFPVDHISGGVSFVGIIDAFPNMVSSPVDHSALTTGIFYFTIRNGGKDVGCC